MISPLAYKNTKFFLVRIVDNHLLYWLASKPWTSLFPTKLPTVNYLCSLLDTDSGVITFKGIWELELANGILDAGLSPLALYFFFQPTFRKQVSGSSNIGLTL
ncbi:hypothetical protein ACOSQ3_000251 [Xanthoceras sorbifolium]